MLASTSSKKYSGEKFIQPTYNSISKTHTRQKSELEQNSLNYLSSRNQKGAEAQRNVTYLDSVLNKIRAESPMRQATNFSNTVYTNNASPQKSYGTYERKSIEKNPQMYVTSERKSIDRTPQVYGTSERKSIEKNPQIYGTSERKNLDRHTQDPKPRYASPLRSKVDDSPRPVSPGRQVYSQVNSTQRANSPLRNRVVNNNDIINRNINQNDRAQSPFRNNIGSPIKAMHNLNTSNHKNNIENILGNSSAQNFLNDKTKIDYSTDKYEIPSPTKLITSSEIKKDAPVIKLEKGSSYTSQKSYNNNQMKPNNYIMNTNNINFNKT